jgi:beta-lactamase regulating signal transducer with metallopeptidase domain
MSTLFGDSTVSIAFWMIAKTTALLVAAAAAQYTFLRRASAATRHLVWLLALTGVLVLPVLSVVVPQWRIPVDVAPDAIGAAPTVSLASAVQVLPRIEANITVDPPPSPAMPAPERMSPMGIAAAVYAAGVFVLLFRLVIDLLYGRRFARDAQAIEDPEWTSLLAGCADRMRVTSPVRLLRSRQRNVPLTFGTRRPSIVIPSIADTWSIDRRRAVLLHELAHVARFDCLTQTVGVAACAVSWFHPMVWWVARRLGTERELACDDRVIAAGTEPRDYAGHLLEIAYSFGAHRAPALAVTMARPRQLESRMLAALDAARNRRVPPARVRLASAVVALLVLAIVAGAKPVSTAAGVAEAPPQEPSRWTGSQMTPSSEPQQLTKTKVKVAAKQLKSIDWFAVAGLKSARASLSRAISAATEFAQDSGTGTWEIRTTDAKGTVHLRLMERNSSSGSNVPVEQLEGLTAGQLAAGGPVQFRVRRDAGTLTFEGVIRNGVGAGTFAFQPDPGFPNQLVKRGFARPTAGEQYQLARYDVGFAFLDELTKQGYARPQTSDLVRAGQHGVQATYVREMGALGYRLGSLDPLITLRDHGVTPSYVKELADQGYKGLAADDLREARDHGVTPDYVRGMRDSGYVSLSMPELVTARDHGVTAEFAGQLSDAGYSKLPLDQLLRVRDHGVSPEYVRELKGLGYALSIDDLVRARDHGVTLDYVREMVALGYRDQPMDALVRVRDHGVTPRFAQELKSLGYDRLSLDELVTLRDHGVTPDRVRAANARAGTRLPIDMLRSLADGGQR